MVLKINQNAGWMPGNMDGGMKKYMAKSEKSHDGERT